MSAEILAQLIEAGTPATVVAQVALEFARLQSAREAAETADRRSPQAIKQQRYRDRKVSREVTNGNDVTESVTRDREGNAASSLDKSSPQTPLKINLISGVCIASAHEADPIGVPVRAMLVANRLAVAVLTMLATKARHDLAVEGAVDAWNAMAARNSLPTVKRLTAERRSRLRARLAEHGPDAFTEAIAAVERSSFCRGESRDGWRADFDFLLQASSFTKLIEGSYDRQSSQRVGQAYRQAGGQHPGGRVGAASDRVFGGMD